MAGYDQYGINDCEQRDSSQCEQELGRLTTASETDSAIKIFGKNVLSLAIAGETRSASKKLEKINKFKKVRKYCKSTAARRNITMQDDDASASLG